MNSFSKATKRELQEALSDFHRRAENVVHYLDPGRPPHGALSNTRLWAFWHIRLRDFDHVRRVLLGTSPGEETQLPLKYGARVDEPEETKPENFQVSGWRGEWRREYTYCYRGEFPVRIIDLADGMFAVYIGSAYFDSYDDLGEAQGAVETYLEGLER